MSKEVLCDKCYKGGSGICYGKIVLCPLHGAARELLEACKQAVMDLEHGIDPESVGTLGELHAAIKKASS